MTNKIARIKSLTLKLETLSVKNKKNKALQQ